MNDWTGAEVLYTIKSLSKESQVAPVKNVHAYLSNEAKAAKIEETKTRKVIRAEIK